MKSMTAYQISKSIDGELEMFEDLYFIKRDVDIYINRKEKASLCTSRYDYRCRFVSYFNQSKRYDDELEEFEKEFGWPPKQIRKNWKDFESRYRAAASCICFSEYEHRFTNSYLITLNTPGEKDLFENTLFKDYNENPDSYRIYTVYAYIDNEHFVAYSGLTFSFRLKYRHNEHKNDRIGNYFRENFSCELPNVTIMETDLTPTEAQYFEDFYRKRFEEEGYTVLNVAPTGVGTSSLGSARIHMARRDYDKICSEAKKYDTWKDFRLNSPEIYKIAVRRLYDFPWLKRERHPRGYWTKERIIEESLKYSTKGEFKKKCYSGYSAAVSKKMLDELIWLKKKD